MSSITAADLRLGGRLTAAADAMAADHLNRAAGIFAEIADELNQEATAVGLLAEDVEATSAIPTASPVAAPVIAARPAQQATPMDLQSCARNAHSYGEPDSNGWRTCRVCEMVNVAPPGESSIDISSRRE